MEFVKMAVNNDLVSMKAKRLQRCMKVPQESWGHVKIFSDMKIFTADSFE